MLRIVHLEDSPADGKLIQAALASGGLECEIVRVDSRAAFENALAAQAPDVILADYQLPSFDGAEALEIAQRNAPTVPFIFVTGALGEEIAIETLKRGATDYVLKQRLSRLVPAVTRALAEAAERRQRRQAEAEIVLLNRTLQQRLEELETLYMVAPIGIAVARDPECHDIQVNPVGAAMVGIAPQSNASKSGPRAAELSFKMLRNGQEVPQEELPMQTAARTGKTIMNEEYEVVRGDGSRVTLLEYAAPLHDDAGRVRGSVGIWVDISNYKATEAALLGAREQAEHLGRVKDEFLATLSHELRTPLTPMLGWVRMMQLRRLPPSELERGVNVIERNIHALTALVDDLLDISRIISGKLRITFEPVDLTEVLDSAADTVRSAAEARGVALSVDTAACSVSVSGDKSRLQQAVWNLLSNAIKFTPRGGAVHAGCTIEDDMAKIVVADNGEGIAPEYLPHVFDRFSQAESSSTRRHGGLGLGLSIVRHVVELHGGSVQGASPGRDQGAAFTLTLPVLRREGPVPAAEPAPAVAAASLPLRGVRVLVVDDETDTRELIGFALRNAGAEIMSAESADAALRQALDWRPDIAVVDINMPGKDGYTLLELLRRTLPRFPVLALTAQARVEDRQRALAAGFDCFLGKPVDPLDLVGAITALRSAKRQG